MWNKIIEKSKSDIPFIEACEFLIKSGAHSGKTISEVHREEPAYLFWLSCADLGEISIIAKKYLEFIDSHELLSAL